MATKTKVIRKLVKIDEEKCNGCGACIISCAEGALKLIDGKAKLISEKYCDGLGACLGKCPMDAITVIDQEAEEFDEAAVEQLHREEAAAQKTTPCACPSAAVRQISQADEAEETEQKRQPSQLGHWPVQLALVPPTAPFLRGADVLLTSHCVPFAYAGFHRDLLRGHALLIACPKLDDYHAHLDKLTSILEQADLKSITVVHMEVPCCTGLVYLARQAIRDSGKDVPLSEVTISVQGEVKSRS
jgi:NAD-dependent dihydropyrimidine dehydrogenase PreA subunit